MVGTVSPRQRLCAAGPLTEHADIRHHPLGVVPASDESSFDPPLVPTEPSSHAGRGLVTKVSPLSVADTVSRLSAVLAAGGMKLFAVIDHSGEAKSNGLELRDTKLVIFGSPQAGTPVMVAAPLAALDLPLKVLVWADAHQTNVSYTAPEELAARYELSDELAARLAGIHAVTDAVISR
jgi:uncharacterized protein (DUF302 family)